MFIWLKEFGLIYVNILTPSQQGNTGGGGGMWSIIL